MKDINLAKLIFLILIFVFIFGIFYLVFFENDIKYQEKALISREENIKKINEVYKKNFEIIGKIDSAFIIEEEINSDGNEIRKDYYVFGEEEKSLIKVKEYIGLDVKESPILEKEIYIDLTKKVEGTENLYNDVTIINIKDWSSETIDNYEFKSPIEKISELINKRYDLEKDYKKVALDTNNEIYINNWPKLNHRSYGWSYERKENERDEYLSFSITNEEKCLYLNYEEYEDNKRTEKITIQLSKQKGCIDDVTVPE